MKRIGDLELRQGIIWRQVFAQEKVNQTVKTPIGGTPHIYESAKPAGEIITLFAGVDKFYRSFFTHDEMMQLIRMRDEVGATFPFTWEDIVKDLPVMFYREGSSINYQTTLTNGSGYEQRLSSLSGRELYETTIQLIAMQPFTIKG